MTAATTSSNKSNSFFSVRFRNKMADDLKLFIINLCLQLLCLPVLTGIALSASHYHEIFINSQSHYYNNTQEYIPFFILAIISLIISISLGLVIPMINFKYLYSKSLVDMNYSLPINNLQRFNADFFSGLIVYIVPPLIGASIAGIELFIGSRFIKLLPQIADNINEFIRIGFVVIIGMILLYTISVFAISFAGSIFEAIFSMVAVNVMIPVFLFLSWMNIVSASHFGLDSESLLTNYPFFTTSPIGVLGYILFYSERDYISEYSSYIYSSSYSNTIYFNFMIRTLLFIVLVFVITYLLYKHRKAEDVSKPYVYIAFYYTVMCVAVYCITSALKIIDPLNGIIPAIIISGLLWLVMEVIRRRGFRRFGTAVISFAAAIVVVSGIIKIINATQGLGMAKRIPSASSVTDIEISTWGNSDMLSKDLLMHDPQIISDAIELNKEMVDRHYNPDNYDYEMSDLKTYRFDEVKEEKEKNKENKKRYHIDEQYIRITYYTRSGTSIIRQFKIPTKMMTKLFCDIYTSAEYADQTADEMFKSSLTDDKNTFSYNLTPETAKACSFALTDKLGESKDLVLSVEEGRKLTDAIRQDIKSLTVDDLDNSEFYCRIDDQLINASFSNTLRFFEENNIDYLKTGQELVDEIDIYSETVTIQTDNEYVFTSSLLNYNYKAGDYFLYDDFIKNDTNEYIKLDTTLSLGNYRNHSNLDIVGKHIEFADKEAVGKLFDIATPIVINDKILAEVYCDKVTLYVYDLPENREIVEKAKNGILVYDNKTGELYQEETEEIIYS